MKKTVLILPALAAALLMACSAPDTGTEIYDDNPGESSAMEGNRIPEEDIRDDGDKTENTEFDEMGSDEDAVRDTSRLH